MSKSSSVIIDNSHAHCEILRTRIAATQSDIPLTTQHIEVNLFSQLTPFINRIATSRTRISRQHSSYTKHVEFHGNTFTVTFAKKV